MTNAWAIPKVARQGSEALRKLPDVDAHFIGNRWWEPAAPESGVFLAIFAVQLHAKVRFYDARCCGRFSAGEPVLVAVENRPRCGLLAR